ncbi:hypothetical protein [Cellulomonas sp. P5_C6]
MHVVRVSSALVVLLVAGCAVGSSATQADEARALTDPVTQAASAVQTSLLSVQLLGDDRVTAPVADTSLLDSIAVLAEAADAVTTFVPADPTGSGWQSDALEAVQAAQVAAADARAWANGATDSEEAAAARLRDSADALDAMSAELEAAGGS